MAQHDGMIGTHIMVPLDGSELAERALPAAARLAEALKATLVLARVAVPATYLFAAPGEQVPAEVYQQFANDEARAAEEYLATLARPLREGGLPVQTVVAHGEPAAALLDQLSPLQIGLLVMTTHGRTGMARFALGSVADRLVRASHVPVLLLRPLIEDRPFERLDRAVVPLDGSDLAEAALNVAEVLAGALIRNVTLLRVVAHGDGHRIRSEMEAAERYLDAVAAKISRQMAGRASVRTQVLGGDPADRIIRRAGEECDLVIMATHGSSGTRRWAFGSVADRVLHDTGTPLLLVCPG